MAEKLSLKELLKQDAIFQKKVGRILKMKVKDELWVEELESLHARRAVAALNTSGLLQNSQFVAIDSNIDNQTVRSRCVSIKMRAMKQVVTFEETIKYLKKYITHKYSKRLAKRYSTMTERKGAVEFALSDVEQYIGRLNFVIRIADEIIKDCDAAGFTLMRINEMLVQRSKDK